MSTVANVLRTEPSTALAGAVICISGTLSLGKQDTTTLLQTHGANVASSVTAKVTHVLTSAADAAKKTSKVASAEAKDIPVIGESFVVASIESGSLADASEHHPANSSGFGCKRGRESTPGAPEGSTKLHKGASVDKANANQSLWDAVASKDLDAAKVAHSLGACPDLARVPMKDNDATLCIVPLAEVDEKGTLESHHVNDSCAPMEEMLITTLAMASKNGDLPMLQWLLDVGCDVNGTIHATIGDGYGGGGFTPLYFATESIDATRMLCARGANANAHCCEDGYEYTHPTRSVLLSADHAGEIAGCLLHHGANPNDVCADGLWGDGDSSLDSYWPRVVSSGDVHYATELLENYKADPNWPLSVSVATSANDQMDEILERVMLGRTVLMIAILNVDKPMVELLLKHGADVNLSEFINSVDAESDTMGDAAKYFDDNDEVIESKKATPLSVALHTGNEIIAELLRSRGAVADADNAEVPWAGGHAWERTDSNE